MMVSSYDFLSFRGGSKSRTRNFEIPGSLVQRNVLRWTSAPE